MQVLMHQLLGMLLLPPVNVLLLAALALALRSRCRRLAWALLVLSGVLLYAFATPRVAMWLNAPLEAYSVVQPEVLKASDAIVVLGGGKKPAPEYGGNELGADSLARLRYAVYLQRQSRLPLLLSGGSPLGGEPEAWVMQRTLLRDYGLAPFWVESESNTTADNARLSAAMLKTAGVRRIVLVTQAWHMRRALPLFEAQGLQVVAAPTGFSRYDGSGVFWWLPSGRAMQESHQALREYVGMLYYWLRNRF